MQKIPTMFERDWNGDRSRVVNIVTPGCEWVANGEGVATRKYDGTCCLIKYGKLHKRCEVKGDKAAPLHFELIQSDLDATGKRVGWVPVEDGPEDQWHREAFDRIKGTMLAPDGTYELLGPKVQGNPENYTTHILLKHTNVDTYSDIPRDFSGLRLWLATQGQRIEGLVFHHPDGRMAKIKLRDFGIKRETGKRDL